ncbi:MAG TPA: hypothetical protein VE666_12085, partial [Mycobacterium sp.]|nr:hypothetical protein [Mycobacterium sp.]
GRGSRSTAAEIDDAPTDVNVAAAGPAVRDDGKRNSGVIPAEPPASATQSAVAVTPVDPVSRLVSNLLTAALSPFASSAPTDPAQAPAGLMMLAVTRRESDQRASTPTNEQLTTSAVDADFISSPHDFGLFSVTSAADPDDNHYVAFVFSTPLFTNVLTSGTDPEDNLGFGTASIGVAGQTVNTFISPFFTFSFAIPFTDPFAGLFTELVRLGF